MHFASIDYLIFLPVAVFAYWLAPRRARVGLVAACSLLFYGSWNWAYVPLLLGTVGFAWLGGLWMAEQRKTGRSGLGLVVVVTACFS